MDNTAPSHQPIGVFDSGIGGLSILQALRDELPHEHFVYLADSAHAPYGERGDAFVTQRTRSITQHLRAQHRIKALVVACNTATTAAIHHIRAEHPDLPLVGVEPAIKPAASHTQTGRVGVIGTPSTINSSAYKKALEAISPEITVYTQACPLFVPLAEEGWTEGEITELAAERYLAPLREHGIDVLVRRHTAEVGQDAAALTHSDTGVASQLITRTYSGGEHEQRGVDGGAVGEFDHDSVVGLRNSRRPDSGVDSEPEFGDEASE